MRGVKLEFYDHPFDCPICGKHIVYTSMHTVIVDSRRKYPSCKGELLIHDGAATVIGEKTTEARARGIRKTFAEIITRARGWLCQIQTSLDAGLPTKASRFLLSIPRT